MEVEHRVQQRHVARLGGEDRLSREVEDKAGARRARVGELERLERLRVERRRVGCAPRLVERNGVLKRDA
jgi:hypothetical protein